MARSIADMRRDSSAAEVFRRNQIRRFKLRATLKGVWQLTGLTDHEGNVETDEGDHFGNVGVWARPPTGRGEAIRLLLDRGHAVIAATRDEITRVALAAKVALAAGEAALYSAGGGGGAVVWCKADGTIEARSWGGTAVPLATLADVQAQRTALADLRTWVLAQFDGGSGHTHATSGAPPTPPAVIPPLSTPSAPSTPVGTTKLRGE